MSESPLEAAAWALAHYWHGTASRIWDAPAPVEPDEDDYGAARAVLQAVGVPCHDTEDD